ASIARLERGLPATRLRLAPAMVGFGRALLDAGRAAEARPVLERGLELSLQQFGETDWRTAEARLALGMCRQALGDAMPAAELIRASRRALQPYRTAQPGLTRQADSAAAALAR
ncbi:MAG TPA: hypothetical protein VFZ26_08580, partial [Gemmatimonadales bacterium]